MFSSSSDWAELSLAVVALIKKDMATTQVLLVSIVATNYFLLVGLGRMYDHKRLCRTQSILDTRMYYSSAWLWLCYLPLLKTALLVRGDSTMPS
jgi:hypothetical protein